MARIPSAEEVARRLAPVTERDLSGPDDAGEPAGDATVSPQMLPKSLERQIARRVAARAAYAQDRNPAPGMILAVLPAAPGGEAALAQEPLPVLLDILEADGKAWRGWVVGRDRGHATGWDLILGPEEEDRDPACEFIQAWNPVRVALPKEVRILGQLSPHRLAAVRTLAVDHEKGFISGPRDEHRLGVALARELSDGTGVVTGTPLAGERDPRAAYQRAYREIAARLPQPAPAEPAAMPRASRRSLWQRMLGLPAWQLGGAVATLLLAPLVVMLVMQGQPEAPPIASAPPILPQATHRYAGTGEVQQLRVADPEASAREIVAALREIGALPDTRNGWAGMVSIRADLKGIPATDQGRFLARFKLAPPSDGVLKVDLVEIEIAHGAKNHETDRGNGVGK
jgi:hypothetical protein